MDDTQFYFAQVRVTKTGGIFTCHRHADKNLAVLECNDIGRTASFEKPPVQGHHAAIRDQPDEYLPRLRRQELRAAADSARQSQGSFGKQLEPLEINFDRAL